MFWPRCYALCVLLVFGTVHGRSFLVNSIDISDKTKIFQTREVGMIYRQHNLQRDDNTHNTVDQFNSQIASHQRTRRSNATHVMQHILEQIKKGHMTTESMSHWMGQLQTLYNQGKLDSHDLRDFINDMHQSLAHSPFEGACCPFGK